MTPCFDFVKSSQGQDVIVKMKQVDALEGQNAVLDQDGDISTQNFNEDIVYIYESM